jgi:hypothetical protein
MPPELKKQITAAALELRRQGKSWNEMYGTLEKRLAIPDLRSQIKIESSGTKTEDGVQKPKLKNRRTRQENRRSATFRRNAEEAANQLSPQKRKLFLNKQAKIKARGMQADHINELWITKSTRENTSPEQFKRIQQKYPMGNDPANIQQLTREQNLAKHREWKALQKHLGKMSAPVDEENLPTRSEQLGFKTIEPWFSQID